MVVSINTEPNKQEFEDLLANTISSLHDEAKEQPQLYLDLNGSKLEGKVVDIMNDRAQGTPFENSIELISGQRFPDIIANKFYGVEVKTTKSNHWKSTGSSVAEGTRVDGIERIFMLFGKMCTPVEFKCKPYEECLSEVVVTHSPRYLIDMDLPRGKTFFDKIKMPYDEFRQQANPIQTVVNYYKKQTKKGDKVWWLDTDNPSNMVIRIWNNLPKAERNYYQIKGYCLFPELVSNKSDKFNRFAMWLSMSENIVCPNIRDMFTAGGQGSITHGGITYTHIPKILTKLHDNLLLIKEQLFLTDKTELAEIWNIPVSNENKFSLWTKLICANIKDPKYNSIFKDILK